MKELNVYAFFSFIAYGLVKHAYNHMTMFWTSPPYSSERRAQYKREDTRLALFCAVFGPLGVLAGLVWCACERSIGLNYDLDF